MTEYLEDESLYYDKVEELDEAKELIKELKRMIIKLVLELQKAPSLYPYNKRVVDLIDQALKLCQRE